MRSAKYVLLESFLFSFFLPSPSLLEGLNSTSFERGKDNYEDLLLDSKPPETYAIYSWTPHEKSTIIAAWQSPGGPEVKEGHFPHSGIEFALHLESRMSKNKSSSVLHGFSFNTGCCWIPNRSDSDTESPGVSLGCKRTPFLRSLLNFSLCTIITIIVIHNNTASLLLLCFTFVQIRSCVSIQEVGKRASNTWLIVWSQEEKSAWN